MNDRYTETKRYGRFGPIPRSAVSRFWPKVDKAGPLPEARPELGPCWLWTGALTKGYGVTGVGNGHMYAHRMSYEMHVGPIPEGMVIDHLCRTTRCVNPAHLEPVTMRTNTLRGIAPAAFRAQQTHCKRGHPLSGPNLYLEPKHPTVRHCKACVMIRRRALAARRAA